MSLNNISDTQPETLDSVTAHAGLLNECNIAPEVIAWFLNLLGLSRKLDAFNLSEQDMQNALAVKELKAFNACDSIEVDSDATYVSPELLINICTELHSKAKPVKINHRWEPESFYDFSLPGGSDHRDFLVESLRYTGDDKALISTIRQALPLWDHSSNVVPFTFLMPNSELASDCWHAYNLDKDETANLLSSPGGAVALLSLLQLMGLSSNAIDAFLRQAGLLRLTPGGKDGAFLALDKRYPGFSFDGYCLTDQAFPEIYDLMTHSERSNTSIATPVIPRIGGTRRQKFSIVTGQKMNLDEGRGATEKDLASMREALAYLMTHTGGYAVTINLPLQNEFMRYAKLATPSLVVPGLWAEVIKSHRPCNNKQTLVDTMPVEVEGESPRQRAVRKRKAARVAHKAFAKDLLDQSLSKADRAIHHCYPAPDEYQY